MKQNVAPEWEYIAANPLARQSKPGRYAVDSSPTRTGRSTKSNEKQAALADFLDGFDGKLVIYAEFTESINRISSLLTKRKTKHVILDGRQQDKGIWRQFQADDETRVIICQYQSGASGIDLFAADTMLFYEPTLSSVTYGQAKDRIHRIGQRRACSYYRLVTKGTIERDIWTALDGALDFGKAMFERYLADYQKGYAKK